MPVRSQSGNAESARGKMSGKPIRKNKEERKKREGKREVKARGKEKKRSKSKTMRTRYKWVEGTQDLIVAG